MPGNPKGSRWRSTPRDARKSPEARWTIPKDLQKLVRAAAAAAGEPKPSPFVAACLRVALRHEEEVLAELRVPTASSNTSPQE